MGRFYFTRPGLLRNLTNATRFRARSRACSRAYSRTRFRASSVMKHYWPVAKPYRPFTNHYFCIFLHPTSFVSNFFRKCVTHSKIFTFYNYLKKSQAAPAEHFIHLDIYPHITCAPFPCAFFSIHYFFIAFIAKVKKTRGILLWRYLHK